MNHRELTNRELSSHSMAFHQIPIIDIEPLLNGSNPEGVAREIGEVCENIGFMYIKNHGVSESLIANAYQQAAAFFALPQAEKERLNITHSGQTLRGYIPKYGENVDPEYSRDLKECFDLGQPGHVVSPFFGPNPVPRQLPNFEATFNAYQQAMLQLAKRLAGAIALSLDLPVDYFTAQQQQPITIQRLLHYPPQKGKVSLEEMGIGAHTDYGFLTILSQDDNGGLQVQNSDGDWVDAPPIPGTFVVNIGDLVQTLTNDRYLSTMHRVINTTGKERYSLPFFLDMDFDAVVEPVPTCVTPENPARYTAYKCGEHKYQRFKASYAHLQNT